MLPTFVIGLREGLEAVLIVSIIAAFLQQRGRSDSLRWVWTGVGLAASLCLAFGLTLHFLEESLPQKEQEALETIIAGVAVIFVASMVVWMRRNARNLKAGLEENAESALASNSVLALVLMAFLAVLREGFETSVFVLAVFDSATDPVAASLGVVLGLTVAVILGYAMYRGGVRINLSRFFRFTGVVLVLVAAGLAASALHTAHEAGWFNIMQNQALDLTWLISPGSVRAALITGMFGLQPKPTTGEALGWLLVAVPLVLYVLWPATPRHDTGSKHWGLSQALRRMRGTAGIALLAILVLTSCGGSNDADSVDSDSAQSIEFTITDAGCDPAEASIDAGPTTFKVTNADASAVTEFEVLDGTRILGEVENITPGLGGNFSLNLSPGTYTLYCPNGSTAERGTLTVTGDASGSIENDPASKQAVEAYRAYVQEQADDLVASTTDFVDAIEDDDVERAKSLYASTRVPYERIEPVAESFGDLDPAIDAREGDVPADEWTGFHRIEKALWIDGTTENMEPIAQKLLEDVQRLQAGISDTPFEIAQIANGSVELLNEVSASKITGEEERYSHTDLIDFEANVDGARAAFSAVKPILEDQDADLAADITKQFDEVDSALDPYRSGDGFALYSELTQQDTRALSQSIDSLAEPLSRVAGLIVVSGA